MKKRVRPAILPDAVRKEVLKLYQQGKTYKAVGQLTGVKESTVAKIIQKHKKLELQASLPKTKETNKERDTLVKFYQQEKSITAAARLAGVDRCAAGRIIRKMINKGELRTCTRQMSTITDEQREHLVKLYKQGKSIRDAARIAGVNENTSGAIIRRHIRKDERPPKICRSMTHEQRDVLLKGYQEENSIAAAAQIAGVSAHVAGRFIRKMKGELQTSAVIPTSSQQSNCSTDPS